MVYLLTELRLIQGKYAIKTGSDRLPDFVVLDAPATWEVREREGFLQVHAEMGWSTFGTILARRRTWPAMCLALIQHWSSIYQKLCLVIGPTDDCFREDMDVHV